MNAIHWTAILAGLFAAGVVLTDNSCPQSDLRVLLFWAAALICIAASLIAIGQGLCRWLS